MTLLCNFLTEFGEPPRNCSGLKNWLWEVVQALTLANPIKCGTGAADPTGTDLTNLWGSCDVPPGSFVAWYNTVSTDTTYWYCKNGSVVGCGWIEFEVT